MDAQFIQIVTVAGAAGAFFIVLKWVVDGKLHSDSEVVGLRQDKADLLKLNTEQAEAMKRSTALLEKLVDRRRDSSKREE